MIFALPPMVVVADAAAFTLIGLPTEMPTLASKVPPVKMTVPCEPEAPREEPLPRLRVPEASGTRYLSRCAGVARTSRRG